MMLSSLFYPFFIPFLLALLYPSLESETTPFGSNYDHTNSSQTPSNVLLVTAHPDDECLFFAPTLLSLTSKDNEGANSATMDPKFNVYSLCLSTGDSEGLGDIRTLELERSLDVLRVEKGKRWVLDTPDLPDNITLSWDAKTIAEAVRPFVLEHHITIILTFDQDGVSSHPNHNSIPTGLIYLATSLAASELPAPRVYTLVTVPLHSKYISFVAALFAKVDLLLMRALHSWSMKVISILQSLGFLVNINLRNPPVKIGMWTFVVGIRDYWTALSAMRKHESQLVWFRWLNIVFSRYMWVNEWVEITA